MSLLALIGVLAVAWWSLACMAVALCATAKSGDEAGAIAEREARPCQGRVGSSRIRIGRTCTRSHGNFASRSIGHKPSNSPG